MQLEQQQVVASLMLKSQAVAWSPEVDPAAAGAQLPSRPAGTLAVRPDQSKSLLLQAAST